MHTSICLLALCQLDACMHAWMRHCQMSSSSFRWRLCSWERQWLKSSASCGHLSSVVDRTGAEVQKNHEQIQGPTARKAAQAEPAILPQLVTSIINHTYPHDQAQKNEGTVPYKSSYDTPAPLHPSVSTPPTFLHSDIPPATSC